MAKELTISVEKDHLEKLTEVSGTTALSELIWNSLDADASEVDIRYKSNTSLDTIEWIEIFDNGHGISHSDSLQVFGRLGGSIKKSQRFSPARRLYHGKNGEGRFRSFALGDIVEYEVYFNNNQTNQGEKFRIILDRNNINVAHISDPIFTADSLKSGIKVTIKNINQEKTAKTFQEKMLDGFQEKFAVYYMSYPNFKVFLQGKALDFKSAIKSQNEKTITKYTDTNKKIDIKIHIIEWNKQPEENKTLFFCGAKGVVLHQTDLNLRKINMPITVYIVSPYIQELYDKNQLMLDEMSPLLQEIIQDAKSITKDYIRSRRATSARNVIEDLKIQNVYPYENDPIGALEEIEREVFDILTHEIHSYLPSFQTQEADSKRLTLRLVKEALEKDTGAIKKLIREVLNLPERKQQELVEIIDQTPLEQVISTMREVQDRLRIIYELRLMLYDKEEAQKIKERLQFHKILIKETWIFGDDYTLGADDIALKNVLKMYLKELGREDFAEIVKEGDNTELNKIPDICLWKQYGLGEEGCFKNLVIELKKPDKTITAQEVAQVKTYARRVANDERFPKSKTKWVFYLLGATLNDDVKFDCKQENREFGNIVVQENVSVWVLTWGHILSLAEGRLQYLKNKLNYSINPEEEGIKLLKQKYKELFNG